MKKEFNKIIIPLIVLICFLSCIAFCFMNFSNNDEIFDNSYSNTIDNIEHQNIFYKNQLNNANEDIVKQKPIFSDSKDAIITSFSNLINCKQYSMLCEGKVNTNILGINKTVLSELSTYIYSPNEIVQIVEKYECPTTIMVGVTESYLNYKINNQEYTKTTKSIAYENDEIYSDFSGSSFNPCQYSKYTPILYNMTDNSILSTNDLIIYYNKDGTIDHYSVEFKLNTTTSVIKYGKEISKNANTDSLPIFDTIKMRLEIDNNGNIIELSVFESYKLNVMSLTANCSGVFTYSFFDYNKEPSFVKPTIS